MNNLLPNDQGGMTWATPQRIGQPEHRSHAQALSDVRVVVDTLQQLCEELRTNWPEQCPVSETIDRLLMFSDYAMLRVRSGALKKLGEVADT